MTDEIYGLTLNQHKSVERLVRGDKLIVRDQVDAPAGDHARYRGVARIMLIGRALPVYDPLNSRLVAVFRYRPAGSQITVAMSGTELEGDFVLTIDGNELRVACDATTAELRAALVAVGISLRDCRATAFPGLWEFDFNFGRWAEGRPSLTCEAYEPPEDDTETPIFSGSLSIVNEGWVSATDDGLRYKVIPCVDWMPWETEALKSGAVGSALWGFGVGWMSQAWQCRDWSFAAFDPNVDVFPGDDEIDTGSGGGAT